MVSPTSLSLWHKRVIPLCQIFYPFPPGRLLTWPCWSSSLLVSLTFSKDTICFSSCSPVNGESGCTYNLKKNTGKRPAHKKNLTSCLVHGHHFHMKLKACNILLLGYAVVSQTGISWELRVNTELQDTISPQINACLKYDHKWKTVKQMTWAV